MTEHLRLLEDLSEWMHGALDGNIDYEQGSDLYDRLNDGVMYIEEFIQTKNGVRRMMK